MGTCHGKPSDKGHGSDDRKKVYEAQDSFVRQLVDDGNVTEDDDRDSIGPGMSRDVVLNLDFTNCFKQKYYFKLEKTLIFFLIAVFNLLYGLLNYINVRQ